MKGNVMIRLISLMILIPATLAHVTGQVDLSEPSWLWLTIFAGLNAFQSSFTGWCPACKVKGVCDSGSCSTPEANTSKTDKGCCSKDAAKADSSCCSETTQPEESACCTPSDASDASCCSDDSDCLDIKVLGTDTEYSEATSTLIKTTAKEMNVLCCISKVEETNEITAMGFEAISGVVINGQVIHVGAIPTKSQVTEWLKKTEESDSPSGCCGSCS